MQPNAQNLYTVNNAKKMNNVAQKNATYKNNRALKMFIIMNKTSQQL